MRTLSQRERRFGLATLVVALFAFYSATAWYVFRQPVFSSPDETANYRFAQQVRVTGVPSIPTDVPGAPRSVITTGTALIPGSFPFFPWLFGTFGRFTGTLGMLLLGPGLATLAVFCWYGFVKRVGGGRRVAALAAFLFATFPIFWFYAGRGFWQNGVFVSSLVISMWVSAVAIQRRLWSLWVLVGLVWGVTVMVRPSEVGWLVPGGIVFLVSQWRRIPWRSLGFALLAALVPFLLALAIQKITYGHASSVGYRTEGVLTPPASLDNANTFRRALHVFFPFGLNWYVAFRTFYHQYLANFWFFGYPAAIGVLWLLLRRKTPTWLKWLLVAGGVNALLLIGLYGNYQFVEYPIRFGPPLDSSYERYWLPLLLLASIGGAWLLAQLRRLQFGTVLVSLMLAGWLGWAGWTMWNSEIGVHQTFPFFRLWQQQAQWVTANTPENAVILGNDKIVTPPRHVIGVNMSAPLEAYPLGSIPTLWPTFIMYDQPNQLEKLEKLYPAYTLGPVLGGPETNLVAIQPVR